MYERNGMEWNGICACHPFIPYMSSLLSNAFIFTHHTHFAIIVMMRTKPTTIFRIFWSRFVWLFSLCTHFLSQLISLCPSPTFYNFTWTAPFLPMIYRKLLHVVHVRLDLSIFLSFCILLICGIMLANAFPTLVNKCVKCGKEDSRTRTRAVKICSEGWRTAKEQQINK